MPVFRMEVRAKQAGDDPTGPGVLAEIRQLGIGEVTEVRAARCFCCKGTEGVLTAENLERMAREVLIDPVTETFEVAGRGDAATRGRGEGKIIEVHLKPGVMDPVAASCEMAIGDLLAESEAGSQKSEMPVQVLTGKKYELLGNLNDDLLRVIAKRLLVNESIETGHFAEFTPAEFPRGQAYQFRVDACGDAGVDRRAVAGAFAEGAFVSGPARDAGDPGVFPAAAARADGCGTRDAGADLERALRAQDAQGDGGICGGGSAGGGATEASVRACR